MNIEQWLGEENKLGIDIWKHKYQHDNESFDQWIARITNNDEEIKSLILSKKFLFGGRILSNRGLNKLSNKKCSLSNCYVISAPEDNIESIFETCGKLARTYSYGGGCGIDISKLRPYNAKVNNASSTTSGATSFMDLFSKITEVIGQNGRRGALMISISCEHPDMPEFIEIKKDLDKVTKANISIRFTDRFMNAVTLNEDIDLTFKSESSCGEEIITRKINAREVFLKMAESNWQMAEPGALFWDTICNWNLMSNNKDFEYAGTNPCAEEPLPAGGSCLLGSINLAEFVNEDGSFKTDDFKKTVHIATRALNEVLDEGLPLHPLQEQRDSVSKLRQIGLGIMGLGDMLIKMKLRYGSESLDICEKIAHILINESAKESAIIASTKGCFEMYDESILETPFAKSNFDSDTNEIIKKHGLRNSQLLTTAPTGTLSTMIGVTGGIEPIFANSYTRTTKSLHGKDVEYEVFTPIVKEYLLKHDLPLVKESLSKLPSYFVTAPEIHYRDRIKMQSAWQFAIDASISSTVNLPENTTVEDVFNIYLYAWKCGLKGITIYRDNCSRTPILKKKEDKKEEIKIDEIKRGTVIKHDDNNLIGLKRTVMSGCGRVHVSAFFDKNNGEFAELFLGKGSTGGCYSSLNGLARMVSLSARAGVSIDDIYEQLTSANACPSYTLRTATKKDTSVGNCCPSAIGRALKDMYDEIQNYVISNKKKEVIETKEDDESKCPSCGEKLLHSGGCVECKSCGYSKCG